jgi:hypothetical protein
MLFWTNPWINSHCISDAMPELLDVVPPHRRARRTVVLALHNNGWMQDLLGLLLVPVLIQYLSL